MFTSMCLALTLVGDCGCPTTFYSGYHGYPGYGYTYYSPGIHYGHGYRMHYGGYGPTYRSPSYGSWTYMYPTHGYQTYYSYPTLGYTYGYASPGATQAYGQSQFRGDTRGYRARGDRYGSEQRRGYGPRGAAEPGPPPAPGAVPREERPGEQRQGNIVQMTDQMRFQPSRVTIRQGDTVEWRNTSRMPHTVTADPDKAKDPKSVMLPEGAEPFDSGRIPPGERFRHTFKVAGTYRYVCIPHEERGMIGEVVVQQRGEGAAPQGAEERGAPRAGEARPDTDEKLPPVPPQGEAAKELPREPGGASEQESPRAPARPEA